MEERFDRGLVKVKEPEPTGTSVGDVPDECLASAFRLLHSKDDRDAVALTCRRWCALEALSRHSLRERANPPTEADFLHKRLMERFPHILCITMRSPHLLNFENRCYTQLTALHFHFCWELTDQSVDYVIAGCPALTQLTLSFSCSISDASLHALARGIPRLEYLDISYGEIFTDVGIDELLKGCPNMQDISFSWCFQVEGWCLRNGKNLKKVQAEGCILTDAGLAEGLQGATSIQIFIMAYLSYLGQTGLGQLGACSKMMQVLCLRMCSTLDDAAVKKIAQGCVNLRVWDLSLSAEVTLGGWQAVALYCAKLQFLDVQASRHFCDRSLLAIQESCPSLRCICVTNCSLLLPESCERFQISRPNVQVEEFAKCGHKSHRHSRYYIYRK